MPDASTVLLIILICTWVFITISINFMSSTIHQSVYKITFISTLVWKGHDSFSLHFVINKITNECFSCFNKVIFTFSVKLSIYKVTIIDITIIYKFTFSSFLSINKITNVIVFLTIPLLLPMSMLLIIWKLSFIEGYALVRIWFIKKNTISISFAIFPFTLINVVVSMH